MLKVVEKVSIVVDGEEIIVELLENGKFKIPEYLLKVEREVIGTYERYNEPSGIVNAGRGKEARKLVTKEITKPSSDLAKQWEGWGTALKPAHEPIVMARKPITAKSIADNVEKYSTGGINIDECRIGDEEITIKGGGNITNDGEKTFFPSKEVNLKREGRFPANCITLEEDQFYSKFFNITPKELSKKASKKDRNSKWNGEEMNGEEKKEQVAFGNEICKNCNKSKFDGRRTGSCCENPEYIPGQVRTQKNNHPTVKPIALMEWLIQLVTPYNGVVYDPFTGSGSTLVAAKRLQQTNDKYKDLKFIGSELEEEYYHIIKARLED